MVENIVYKGLDIFCNCILYTIATLDMKTVIFFVINYAKLIKSFFAAQGSHQFHNINVIIRLELTKITFLHHKFGKVRISFQYDSNKIFAQD